MANTVPWYVQQRAESLAVVFLTREPNLRVLREQGLDFGVDFKLMLNPDDSDAWAGVELRAVASEPPAEVPWHRPGLAKQYFSRIEVPLFLLVINAQTEDHFFGWIKEPVAQNGAVTLVSHLAKENLPLTRLDADIYRQLLAACRSYFQANQQPQTA